MGELTLHKKYLKLLLNSQQGLANSSKHYRSREQVLVEEPVACKNLVRALGSVAYIHIFFGPERGCLFLQSGKSISNRFWDRTCKILEHIGA